MENIKKYYFVYKTTNKINGKFYIGVHETYNLNDGYLGSGKVLRNSVYYYGKENFYREIIEFCNNKEDMYNLERSIVTEEIINHPKCMNLVLGGVGFISDEKHKEISINASKIRLKKFKEDINFYNKFCKSTSDGVKKSYKKGRNINFDKTWWIGKKHSDETKKKISKKSSINQKGEKNSQFGTCWITNGIENKKIKKENEIPNGWKLGRI